MQKFYSHDQLTDMLIQQGCNSSAPTETCILPAANFVIREYPKLESVWSDMSN